ncbi:WXG100 family type VII secretion target [Nocardia colli]|uniref:WXG100 family type VII secretion target n=1 Tax=Nocardia colli TaxID=2545717 RepID=UPI0035E01C8D
MTGELSVNFTDLHHSAGCLADWCGDSSALFDSGHSEISSASSGWVGSSRAALEGALEKLRGSGTALTGRLDGHSSLVTDAVREFSTTEHKSTIELAQVDQPTGRKLLDL